MPSAVDYKEFVQTWMDVYREGGKMADLIARAGITDKAAIGRVRYLRKKGVDLPYLAKSQVLSPLDVDGLNSIVRKSTDASIPVTRGPGRPKKE